MTIEEYILIGTMAGIPMLSLLIMLLLGLPWGKT